MLLDSKPRLRLDNRPPSLMLFLVISLLLHGTVFLGLEIYWHWLAEHTTKLEALTPIKFIEVPADQLTVPPLNTKQKASTNSRAGGETRFKSSSTTKTAARSTTLPPQEQTLPQPKSSTYPQAQSSKPSQPPVALPARGVGYNSSPVAVSRPSKLNPKYTSMLRQNATPVANDRIDSNSKPLELNRQSNTESPVAVSRPSKLNPKYTSMLRQNATPNANRPVVNSRPNITSPVAPSKPKPGSSQPPRQNASPLGGTVRLSNRDIGNLNTAAKPGLQGVDAGKDVDLGPYLDVLRREVEQQWYPKIPDSSKQTIVSFAVSRTGEITELRIRQSSGSNFLDQAALQAVQRAGPFQPLPDSYLAEQLNVNFNFNINIDGKLDLKG